jgi:hypothetical protein
MSRRSLRPQLNQIRGWVRQGRTDAWIAHQLDVTVQQIQAFKREQELEPDGAEPGGAAFEEVDLRAEDDAAIAAELEEEAKRRAEEEAEEAARKAAEEEAAAAAKEAAAAAGEDGGDAEPDDGEKPKRARRSRGGRTRRRTGAPSPLEGTFDHGEEGYGLWLDPAVQDDPVYAEHWAGHRPVEITIDEDQIVIRRAGGSDDDED